MKAISLWQPWASAMALGSKPIETRHWSTKFRGRIAIHAAQRVNKTELTTFWSDPTWRGALYDLGPGKPWELMPFGAIVAVGMLTDCIPTERIPKAQIRLPEGGGKCSTWTAEDMGDFSPGRFGWFFEGIKPLKEPLPFKGKQGFFNVPDELIEGKY